MLNFWLKNVEFAFKTGCSSVASASSMTCARSSTHGSQRKGAAWVVMMIFAIKTRNCVSQTWNLVLKMMNLSDFHDAFPPDPVRVGEKWSNKWWSLIEECRFSIEECRSFHWKRLKKVENGWILHSKTGDVWRVLRQARDRHQVNFALKMINAALKMLNSAFKMMNSALTMTWPASARSPTGSSCWPAHRCCSRVTELRAWSDDTSSARRTCGSSLSAAGSSSQSTASSTACNRNANCFVKFTVANAKRTVNCHWRMLISFLRYGRFFCKWRFYALHSLVPHESNWRIPAVRMLN